MRKASAVLLAALMCVAMFATAASAAKKGGSTAGATAPKFHTATSTVDTSGSLVVAFDERGLGGGDVAYVLDADARYEYACINGGQKNPSAANKRTINSTVSSGASFAVKNGRVVATMTSEAPSAGTFTCPKGQKLTLLSVSYTGIVLTDTTNNVSTNVPSAQRTLRDL